eukprot:403361328
MDSSDSNYIRVGSSSYYTKEQVQTPDSTNLKQAPSFDLKNVPMTMQAKNRQIGSRPNSNSQWDMALMMISSTHQSKDIKRTISNANEILQMIAKGELLNCYVCLSRPVEHYCHYCESSMCSQCMVILVQSQSACPHCRHKEPIINDMKICKQIKRIVKKLKKLMIEEQDIQKAFKCSICKNLMLEPKSCSDCFTNFCQSCIQNKLCTDNRCTECRQNNPSLRKLHKSLSEILDKALISCRFCTENQKYKDLLNHEIECKFKHNALRRNTAQNRQSKNLEGQDSQFNSEKKVPNKFLKGGPKVRNYMPISRRDSRLQVNLLNNEEILQSIGQDQNSCENQSFHSQFQRELIKNGTDYINFRKKASSRQQDLTNGSILYHSGDSEVQKINSEVQQNYQSPPTAKSSFQASAKQSLTKNEVIQQGNKSSSEDQDSDDNNEELYYDENGEPIENFEYDQYELDQQDPETQSPGIRISLHKRISIALKKQETDTRTTYERMKDDLVSWNQTFRSNFDSDNCSSNSVMFYIMLLICGGFEMFFSLCLFFDYKMIQNSKPNIEPYQVSYSIFAVGLLLEFTYWLTTRFYLGKSYIKYIGYKNTKCQNYTTIIANSILTIVPSDMLIFFGYEGHTTYEKKMLNLAWLRRIISVIRIIFQIVAVTGMLRGEFVTTVFCCQILYMVMLLTAIFPQKSDYDAFTWYRRV